MRPSDAFFRSFNNLGLPRRTRQTGGAAAKHIAQRLALATVALAFGCHSTPEIVKHGASITTVSDEALKALIEKSSSLRSIGDFDVTRDGQIDSADIAAIDGLYGRAKALADARYLDPSVDSGLYTGGTVVLGDDLSLSSIADNAAVRAFVIESHWLLDQARFAAVVTWQPDELLSGALARHIPGYNSESMSPPTLCLAVDSLDMASFERAELPAIAVTDLDFTMWRGDLSNTFLGVIAERKLARPDVNPALVTFLRSVGGVDMKQVERNSVHDNVRLIYERAVSTSLPKEERVSIKDAFFLTVQVLEGLEVATVDEAATAAVMTGSMGQAGIIERFITDTSGCGTKALLAKMKARGIEVYFLSATLDVLARAAAKAVGIPEDHAIGSMLEVVDGRYTGRVVSSTYEAKGPVLRQWVGVPPLMVFGDSATSDVPMMLEAVGTGFMVNPRPELLEKDKELAGGRFVSVTFTPADRRAAR